MHYKGYIAGAVLLSTPLPNDFSSCVLECLESMQVDTAGTDIVSLGFNVTTRTLHLAGIAPPSDYQLVLRRVMYSNRAIQPNIDSITVALDDGISSSSVTFPVTVARKRRRQAPMARRHLLSLHPREELITNTNEQPHSLNTFTLTALMCLAIMSVVLVIAIMVWKKQTQPSPIPMA